VRQLVDIPLSSSERSTFGVTDADIANNDLTVLQQHIILGLAKQFEPYLGDSTTPGMLYQNLTTAYPLGIPATETLKKASWRVALNFFLENTSALMPPSVYIPNELLIFTIETLTSIGVTVQDIVDGKQNYCSLEALRIQKQFTDSPNLLDSLTWKQALIVNDPNLSGNDKTDVSAVAKQASWLYVTALFG
jgi:hypothetical protein